MKAALLVEPGKVVLGDVPDPEPGPGEVAISVGGVGLCGSDMAVFSGRWKAPAYPWIMGHEAFGVVAAVGENVSPGRVGQTVVVEPNVACLACDQCDRGWTSACGGRRSVGMNRPGALAERLVVPSRFAWAIPEMPITDRVCVEPTTVAMAALRRLATSLPDAALVVGLGAQGMVMSLALQDRGVTVYGQDVNDDRVAFAADLGVVPVASRDAGPFRLVVDTVGSPSAMEMSLDHVAVGGTVLCLGLDSRPLELTAQALVRRQLILQGSLTYDHPADFEATITMLADGRFAPGRIVSDEYPLEAAQAAFEGARTARGKSWIRVAG